MNPIEYEVGSGNVFADIGVDDPTDACAKAELTKKITAMIERRRVTDSAAAALLGIDRGEISRLLSGHFDAFSVATLTGFARKLEQSAETRISERQRGRVPRVAV